MRILWSPFAIEDLVAIKNYIDQRNQKAAQEVADRILQAVNHLSKHPEIGVETHRTDVRKLIIGGTPYIIPYRIKDGDLEILEVFDARQKAPRTDLSKREK